MLQKLVVVVTSATSGEVLERWAFDIEVDAEVTAERFVSAQLNAFYLPQVSFIILFLTMYTSIHSYHHSTNIEKPEKEIMSEIQAIIRQITSSVTFLPLLDEPCTFDLLVYTNKDADVPKAWEESDPKYITNSEEVRLRSFTTKVCYCTHICYTTVEGGMTHVADFSFDANCDLHMSAGPQGRHDGVVQGRCMKIVWSQCNTWHKLTATKVECSLVVR